MKEVLFDSHAILKFYQDEDGAEKIEQLLISARQGELSAYMSEINLGEVYYMSIRRIGLTAARDYMEQFSELPIRIIPPSSDIIWSASEIKAEYPISYADCFAVATALKFEASIITGDPEFKKVESIIEIVWI
jgi:predicted nucleic acid-binding protein